ncbi:MAG: hypothetical protein K2J15_06800, partial [Muribaculaceae bacterium]|nr:hypothetical protein [Muribaculaceae bacterium]
MSVSFFIARRLSLNSSKGGISPAVGVGIAAVALAVLVMTCALAVVGGFKREISSKITGFNSHLTVVPLISVNNSDDSDMPLDSQTAIITMTPALKTILDSCNYISEYNLQASAPAIFKTHDDFRGVYLKSLSGADNRRFLEESIQSDSIPDYSLDSSRNLILIPSLIADALSLRTGDKIDTYFMTDRIIVRPLRIAGIYNSHFSTYDQAYAFSSLSLIQEIGELKSNQGTSIAISVDNFDNVQENTIDLINRLGNAYLDGRIYRQYHVNNALQSGAAYYHWLSMLDTNVVVILTLMIIVAIVTIISGMLILMV